MTGEEKLQYVERQIAYLQYGAMRIECPYCKVGAQKDGNLCCAPLALAVGAILDRLAMEERIEMAKRIEEAAENQPKVTIQ